MSGRRRDRLKSFFTSGKNREQPSAPSTPSSSQPALGPLPAGDPRVVHTASTLHFQRASSINDAPFAEGDLTSISRAAKLTRGSGSGIDNVALALDIIEKLAGVVETVPFIAPIAGSFSQIIKACKEVRETNDKRNILVESITRITQDLCATILRMEATNHVDLIGRLKSDVETYARLLDKASRVVAEYDTRRSVVRVAARTQLGNELSTVNQELDSFGVRFRSNRLVDLSIQQNRMTRKLDQVHDMTIAENLEKWLRSPPDMGRKQHEIQKLRKEGTGRWLLDHDLFVEWQDNSGALWIQGPSGSGKSVLSSAIVNKLIEDQRLFRNLGKSSAVAFFYFDFKDKEDNVVERALRRIILQLSAQSPYHCRALNMLYELSKGQTIPSYEELQQVLGELLLELGRTYIVLDALDECPDTEQDKLVECIAMLQHYTHSPLHLLITSQPRTIFTDSFKTLPCIPLKAKVTEKDIRIFLEGELQTNRKLKTWASRANSITDRIVRKSNGMFRLAACLLVELSRSRWQDELDKILDDLPTDLFGIYDRFLEPIPKNHWVYVAGVLRWLVFSVQSWTLGNLADAIAFDFSDPKQYVYLPRRREDNTIAIPGWLEGLVTFGEESDWVHLAHASVQDYILSTAFVDHFGYDLSADLSHAFLAQTCMDYFFRFSNDSPDPATFRNYPVAIYAAKYWCHHLLLCRDQAALLDNAMRLLEEGSKQYFALSQLRSWTEIHWRAPQRSPLQICSEAGYTAGVRALLQKGADVNVYDKHRGSTLQVASEKGYTEIVKILLEHGAEVNVENEQYGSPLQAAVYWGHPEIVYLLLENGADVNAHGGEDGSALEIVSTRGHTELVLVLLANGADVHGGKYPGSALLAACRKGHLEIARILLEHGADANTHCEYITQQTRLHRESALHAACGSFNKDLVHLLLSQGASVDGPGGEYRTPLHQLCLNWLLKFYRYHRTSEQHDIIRLLLENGADVNAHTEREGSVLEAAIKGRRTDIVAILMEKGVDVNMHDGAALQTASYCGGRKIVTLPRGCRSVNPGTTCRSVGSAMKPKIFFWETCFFSPKTARKCCQHLRKGL
ncbi:hypothetical protein C8R43DRAFT_1053075 [Mycena crocata]|nr:hypothetical protein C8R43DRAFT_1053075 [Mycena crocata]